MGPSACPTAPQQGPEDKQGIEDRGPSSGPAVMAAAYSLTSTRLCRHGDGPLTCFHLFLTSVVEQSGGARDPSQRGLFRGRPRLITPEQLFDAPGFVSWGPAHLDCELCGAASAPRQAGLVRMVASPCGQKLIPCV